MNIRKMKRITQALSLVLFSVSCNQLQLDVLTRIGKWINKRTKCSVYCIAVNIFKNTFQVSEH